MDIRLIAFDLDGTLLRTDKTISERTRRALYAAKEKGVLLVPATGRLLCSLPQELMDKELTRYFILVNGAQIYDSALDRTLLREELTPEMTMQILRFLRTRNVVRGVYIEGSGYMGKADYADIDAVAATPEMNALMHRVYIQTDDLEEFAKRAASTQKVLAFFRDPDEKQAVIQEISERFTGYAVSSSLGNNIEINAENATKGKALHTLCRAIGLSPAQCMAFGDGTNDCSMLRAAGVGVAMANASEDVKACADVVTEANDEDGLARMIERTLGL